MLPWAYLFGSAACGDAYRDVDVAVMPNAKAFARLTDFGRLQVDLSIAVGAEVVLDRALSVARGLAPESSRWT